MSKFRRWLIYKLLLADNRVLPEDSVSVVYTSENDRDNMLFYVEVIDPSELDD